MTRHIQRWLVVLLAGLAPSAAGASPLDRLDPDRIPAAERFKDQPGELVAVAGSARGLQWGRIDSISFSPDGKWVATASDQPFPNGEAYIWDAQALRRVVTIPEKGPVRGVAFAPDGKSFATLANSLTLYRFKDDAREPRVAFRNVLPNPKPYGNDWMYTDMAFSPDGRILATGNCDLKLWYLDEEQPRAWSSPADYENLVVSLAYAPDGKSLVARHGNGQLRLWDLTDPAKPRQRLEFADLKQDPNHRKRATVAFSADGKLLASAGAEEGIRVWDMNRNKPEVQAIVPARPGSIRSLDFTREPRLLAVGTDKGFTQLWDVEGAKPERRSLIRFGGNQHAVAYQGIHPAVVAVGPRGRLATNGGEHQTLHILDTTEGRLRRQAPIEGHRNKARGVAFAPDGRTLATACDDGFVRLWDLDRPQPTQRSVLPMSAPWSVAFSPDGNFLASGGLGGGVRLWRLTALGPIERASLRQHTTPALAFSDDSKTLFTGDWDGRAALWDLEGRDPDKRVFPGSAREFLWFFADSHLGATREVRLPERRLCSAAFRPDGKGLILGGSSLRVVDDRLAPVTTLKGHKGTVCAVALSADGKTLASVSNGRYSWFASDRRFWKRDSNSDITARIWDMSKQLPEQRAVFENCGDTLALSPDGRLLVCNGGRAGQVFVWNVESGKKLLEWQFPDEVWSLAFAPDGRHIAAANINGSVYILRVKGGK